MNDAEKALFQIVKALHAQYTGDGIWGHTLVEAAQNAIGILEEISDVLLDYRGGYLFDVEDV